MDRGKNRKNKGKASESGTGWSGLSPSGNPHRHAAGNRFVENRVILDHGASVMQISATVDEAPGVHPSIELLDIRFLDI
jgi:hypothetical protein